MRCLNPKRSLDLAALRLMFNFVVRLGLVSQNPVKGVKFLPEGPGAMREISHDEERRYKAAANPLLRDVATLMVETGTRPEEVFTIRPENVYLGKRYLFVPTGETRFARRSIPLTESAIAVLKRRLRKARGAYIFWHKPDVNQPLTTVQKAHEDAIKQAKIKEPLCLYDFRHTFSSRSAMAGVDLATLKELMGHSHISITMRYVHPTPEHKREAVNKLEHFNIEQVFAMHENPSGSPQKSPH